MGARRGELIDAIWFGTDPFSGFPANLYQQDVQGWRSDHQYLASGIEEVRPRTVVEIGVWKGASCIAMAQAIGRLGLDAVVIACDTWLGAEDHWLSDQYYPSLMIEHGQPMIMKTFMSNVMRAGVSDVVVPLALDSINASAVIRKKGVVVDMIHLDAGHEYESVIADLRAWWPLLRPGGLLIGDDYFPEGYWPGVMRAFSEFFPGQALENVGGKCRVVKP